MVGKKTSSGEIFDTVTGEPARGAASEMSPSPTLLPCAAGQPPLKLTEASGPQVTVRCPLSAL
jgi:hypothetical protein